MPPVPQDAWPELPPFAEWEDTHATLLIWTQIAGKIRVEFSPQINHFWGVTLYVTPRGLTTSAIPYGDETFAIDFDFIEHALRIVTSWGEERSFPLQPMSVAAFYAKTLATLNELDIQVKIYPRPVEVVESIPFAEDTKHGQYDAAVVHRWWMALRQVASVLTEFRARYIGKVSPVHFFWGAMDLAVTRFSGRTAPKHPGAIPNCADWVMQEAYSHEVSSAGFWAGGGLGEAALYSYAYPTPAGFKDARVEPAEASFHDGLGEFILPYNSIRSSDPKGKILAFLQSTYEAAADLANWDRDALERHGEWPHAVSV